jgi:hypothetical protein
MTSSTTLGYRSKKKFPRLKTDKKHEKTVFPEKTEKLTSNRKNARFFSTFISQVQRYCSLKSLAYPLGID